MQVKHIDAKELITGINGIDLGGYRGNWGARDMYEDKFGNEIHISNDVKVEIKSLI